MPIYKTAHFQIQADQLDNAKAAVQTFLEYIRANEPDTLVYSAVQSAEDETQFLHFMGFRDAAAEEKHRSSEAVQRFVAVLYPLTVEGVEFRDYDLCASTVG
jgi:quinol monooxygenase YgiN